jgi:hypothetical protein
VAALVTVGGVAAVASAADPEALRHALLYAYGWIPAGAAAAALALLVRAARGGDRGPAVQARIAGLAALAVLAATNYGGFYAYSWKPQLAVYAIPLASVFLVRLHLVELARSPGARAVGAAWLVALAAAGLGLTLRDAHAESATVRGPGGSLRATPAYAAAYQQAVDAVVARTHAGDPVLLAPEMTWMYSLAQRTNPLPEINLLPGTLAGAGREQAAIERLRDAHVRVAVIDRHAFVGFAQTSFGGSFDRLLDRWIRARFVRVATYRTGSGVESPRLELWVRRNG